MISTAIFIFLAIFFTPATVNAGPDDLFFVEDESELRSFLERFEADRAALLRFCGIPDFPVTYSILYYSPVSQACTSRLKKFYTEWASRLDGIKFEALRPASRVDYMLFKNLLKREVLRLKRSEQRINEIRPLIPFAQKIIDLSESKRRMESPEPKNAAAALHEIQKEIDSVVKKIKSGNRQADKILVKRAGEAIPGLRESLNSWFHFYNAYDPLFTWWVKEPYDKTKTLLEEYSSFLEEDVIQSKEEIIAERIGRNALLEELSHEMIPYTPEELIGIGEKELEWCQNEMEKAAAEMGFGNDWKKALEKIKDNHVEPGKQPELVRQLALEAISFVEKRNLITVPELAKQVWRMAMTPPGLQPTNPFITGGEVIRMSYPAANMDHQDKLMVMRSNNIHSTRAIVHHELIPGHHLQLFMISRYRPYRAALFRTDFWREGWALYWEIFLYDIGFPRSPEDRLGMLFWRLHRCARIIFALNFHLGKMNPHEAIDFLITSVGHERFSAIGEVRRPLERDRPLQPLSYMIGALQYRALRRELVDSGRLTDRQFHDAVLENNYMPVAMLRAFLSGKELRKDFAPHWFFYEQ